MEKKIPLISPVLLAGCLIILVGFSIRASYGVFQIPIANEFGWPRAEFSLAIAIQNLAWGFGSPFLEQWPKEWVIEKQLFLELYFMHLD